MSTSPSSSMTISALYFYPIKSLRGVSLPSSPLTSLGLPYDRTFMLLEVLRSISPTADAISKIPGAAITDGVVYKNMHIESYHLSVRFFPDVTFPSESDDRGSVKVEFRPVTPSTSAGTETQIGDDKEKKGESPSVLTFPLIPETENLRQINVEMHKSPTKAYVMPENCNQWFSSHFGREVVLVYLGDNRRSVLMSLPGISPSPAENTQTSGLGGWLNSAKTYVLGATTSSSEADAVDPKITFADCAPYLIVSSTSLSSINPRLENSEEMDITKFRPNIVISGAAAAWEEDFWAELRVSPAASSTNPSTSNSDSDNETERAINITCVHNCGRCRSINVDYSTGAIGTTSAGSVLKKLMSDRRVDAGAKYSPVFGRYSFVQPTSAGRTISVGDVVSVTKRNQEHTVFSEYKILDT